MADHRARPVSNIGELRDRIESYLNSTNVGSDALELAQRLQSAGDVAIFGGMLRDLARSGEQAFNSDIDIVVDADPEHLESLIVDYNFCRNKFGGYRLNGRNAQFDVWALRNTWAIRERYVEADHLSDLTKTTFFNWDAIVYVVHTREIFHSHNYLESIHQKTANIVLKHNPNVLGTVARTLRILVDWDGTLAPDLAAFLEEALESHCLHDIKKAQLDTLGREMLDERTLKSLKAKMRHREAGEFTFALADVRDNELWDECSA
jgi:predicted nucleotidyltransferase